MKYPEAVQLPSKRRHHRNSKHREMFLLSARDEALGHDRKVLELAPEASRNWVIAHEWVVTLGGYIEKAHELLREKPRTLN